ncbi:hypothetical protein [Okeania sp. SIO2C2]|uniref:hypothetical protein n=1 Tax=Okeania sp. SIO2C2 TaxID=2607787 RepID=UPI00257F0E46|nr:hypothetical protein [Okeania sp. SIO2C2]
MDKSGVNLGMNRIYTRAKIGKIVVDKTVRNQGQNITVLGAMTVECLMESMTVTGSTNSAFF